MNNLAQQRSSHALQAILKIRDGKHKLKIKDPKKIATLSSGAGAVIKQNGLGQTLAFWLSKGSENEDLLMLVFHWLVDSSRIKSDISSNEEFLSLVSQCSQYEYLDFQEEVLNYLEWIKRYSNAYLKN